MQRVSRASVSVGEEIVGRIGAGLLVKSFVRLQNVSPGFNPHNVLTAEISLPVEKYPRGLAVVNFYAEAERRIKNIPGVQHAAAVDKLPFAQGVWGVAVRVEGQFEDGSRTLPEIAHYQQITPDYFKVMRIQLLRGRFFADADNRAGQKAIILNDASEKLYFGGENAVGQLVRMQGGKSSQHCSQPPAGDGQFLELLLERAEVDRVTV